VSEAATLLRLALCITTNHMASIPVTQKRRGRPPTGQVPLVTVRLPQDMIDVLNDMAAAEGVTRSVVIRRLLEKALGRKRPST
jgi:hypothetical protein